MIPSSFGALNSPPPHFAVARLIKFEYDPPRSLDEPGLFCHASGRPESVFEYDVVLSGGWDASVNHGSSYRGMFRRVAGAFRTMATSPVDKRS